MIFAIPAMLRFLSKNTLRGEKATAKTTILSHLSIGGALRLLLRFFQLIMALVVIGLYASDLHSASKGGHGHHPAWVYAVFCGSFSALFALIWMIPIIKSWVFFYFDAVIFFFWVVCFGIFGKKYLNRDLKGQDEKEMQRAAWIDMVNMLLWFISAAHGGFVFWKFRKERTPHTGRGEMHA